MKLLLLVISILLTLSVINTRCFAFEETPTLILQPNNDSQIQQIKNRLDDLESQESENEE